MGRWQDDLSWSSDAFSNVVWPACMPYCGGGQLLQMEGRPDTELASLLDQRAGIDGWQLHTDGMRGIASRCQPSGKSWRTFTIRMSRQSGAKTEYEKRKEAISSGKWIYPHITIQAYFDKNGLEMIECAIARTEDLIEMIELGQYSEGRSRDSNGWAVFAKVYWDHMRKNNMRVKIISQMQTADIYRKVLHGIG